MKKQINLDTSRIARYVWIGRKDLNWYQKSTELFIELFGLERLDLVTKLFAATSINTSLKANVTLFRRALHEIENNLPTSDYLPIIMQQLEQIRAGKQLTGRKIRSFARAMLGDPEAVVVDVWLLRAFSQDKKSFRKDPLGRVVYGSLVDYPLFDEIYRAIPETPNPRGLFRSRGATDGQYTDIENYVRQEARAMGIQPRQLSAMIWSGVRIDQGGDANTSYETVLRNKMQNMFTV